MCVVEMAAEEDAEADSWAEVMAAAEMAQKAANNRARAGAVKTENPLFQSADAEEEAAEGVAVAGVAAGILSEEVAAVREANPVFQAVEEEAATEAEQLCEPDTINVSGDQTILFGEEAAATAAAVVM